MSQSCESLLAQVRAESKIKEKKMQRYVSITRLFQRIDLNKSYFLNMVSLPTKLTLAATVASELREVCNTRYLLAYNDLHSVP